VFIYRKSFFLKFKIYIETLLLFSKNDFIKAFGLSVLRYLVFSFQYFLVLKIGGIQSSFSILLALIAITFFVTSAIPTFALSEIAVRGATALYFFHFISNDNVAIISSSVILWIINLALPAIIGLMFIGQLRFIKEN
jgi:hypothetical protein